MTMPHLTNALKLDPSDLLPLYQQLHDQLRDLILRGELLAGAQLPASRQLAKTLGIGRITVKTAYDRLVAAGFLITRTGSGTFVAELPLPEARSAPVPTLKAWGSRALSVPQAPSNAGKGLEFDFGFGRTFPHLFPYDIWRKLLARYLSTDDTLLDRYGSAAGFAPLRHELVNYLARMRGVRCAPEQIVIVNGVQQATDILARLFIEPASEVIVESPGYVEAYRLLQVHGAVLRPIAVDHAGLPVKKLPAHSKATLLFTTPANQFPRGGTMPLARRLALLQWAQTNDVYIIEDDYDSELRYDGRQVTALQSIDTQGRVIYLGTFSKVLFPALRLAYVVLPQPLIKPFLATKRLIDRGSATLMQAAITDFIREGHFDRHLRHLRTAYGERRQTLVAALDHYLPELNYGQTQAGLHIMLQLPAGVTEKAVIKSAETHNLAVYPAAPYALLPTNPALILAFTSIPTHKIAPAIQRLSRSKLLKKSLS